MVAIKIPSCWLSRCFLHYSIVICIGIHCITAVAVKWSPLTVQTLYMGSSWDGEHISCSHQVLLLPTVSLHVSLTCSYFFDEDFFYSAFKSSRGCTGRSELIYGWLQDWHKKQPQVLNQKFPFPFGFSRQQTSLWCQSLALMIFILMTSRWMWMPWLLQPCGCSWNLE